MSNGRLLSLSRIKADRAASRKRPKLPIYRRPQTREDCGQFERPCPFVACRHHLFLDVTAQGHILFPYGPDVAAIETMPHTCALDAAESGERQIREIARGYNMTHQALRLTFHQAMARLREHTTAQDVAVQTESCQDPQVTE